MVLRKIFIISLSLIEKLIINKNKKIKRLKV